MHVFTQHAAKSRASSSTQTEGPKQRMPWRSGPTTNACSGRQATTQTLIGRARQNMGELPSPERLLQTSGRSWLSIMPQREQGRTSWRSLGHTTNTCPRSCSDSDHSVQCATARSVSGRVRHSGSRSCRIAPDRHMHKSVLSFRQICSGSGLCVMQCATAGFV